MVEVQKTDVFARWFNDLRDKRAKACIQARIVRLANGHFGDIAPVGEGVSELRIFMGLLIGFDFVKQGLALVIKRSKSFRILSPSPKGEGRDEGK